MNFLTCFVTDEIIKNSELHEMDSQEFIAFLKEKCQFKLYSDENMSKYVGKYFYDYLRSYGINLSNIRILQSDIHVDKSIGDWDSIVMVSCNPQTGRYSFSRYKKKENLKETSAIRTRSLPYPIVQKRVGLRWWQKFKSRTECAGFFFFS